ncbi:hypothetical protein ONZ51_g5905 [Trametes cubensis]|uniref:Uncharacterized protein n=1 Tax=Trametes cubensis TaxID=1111947 RepID=A0AAD7TT54_9APHY|nr:hypothetical protein ONZ51_g5905 [Trametes cubensis]
MPRFALVMAIPWNQLEHAALILDISKILWGATVHSSGLVGGAIGIHWVKSRLGAESKLETIIAKWDSLLTKLTPEQQEFLERQKPGIVAEMKANLSDLENRLLYLSNLRQDGSYWQRVWPWSPTSRELDDVELAIKDLNKDFLATTRCVYMEDPVYTVLQAHAAIEAGANDVEMGVLDPIANGNPQPAPHTHANQQGPNLAADADANAQIDVPTEEEDIAACRSAVTPSCRPSFAYV